MAVLFAYLRYGYAGALWDGPAWGDPAQYPPGYGYGLLGVHGFWPAFWGAIIVALTGWVLNVVYDKITDND
jgi:hypothetical protein